MIVTIDGPAGAGKSSTARAIARRLGFRHLDSGAFYRAITYAALHAGIPQEDWITLDSQRLDALAVSARPSDGGYRYFMRDTDITDEIRSPDVDAHVSRMASVPAVRDWLLEQLRAAGRSGDLVTDGRDMGTVVFPEAEIKVFLTADPVARARRRLGERGHAHPSQEELQSEVRRLLDRDRQDSARATAPLRRPDGAHLLDTSALTLEQQVEIVADLIRARRSAVN